MSAFPELAWIPTKGKIIPRQSCEKKTVEDDQAALCENSDPSSDEDPSADLKTDEKLNGSSAGRADSRKGDAERLTQMPLSILWCLNSFEKQTPSTEGQTSGYSDFAYVRTMAKDLLQDNVSELDEEDFEPEHSDQDEWNQDEPSQDEWNQDEGSPDSSIADEATATSLSGMASEYTNNDGEMLRRGTKRMIDWRDEASSTKDSSSRRSSDDESVNSSPDRCRKQLK